MRLHTSLTADELRAAVITTGLDKKGVFLAVVEPFGSRSHDHAFEVRLAGERRPGRRWTNSGKWGANTSAGHYAATYDEWGYWMAEVFRRDPDAAFGRVYVGIHDFHQKTKNFYLQADGLPQAYGVS